MDLLDEYKGLFETPIAFDEIVKQKDMIDAAIAELQDQRSKLQSVIEETCPHYTIHVASYSDRDDTSYTYYTVRCAICGKCLASGGRIELVQYLESHDCMVID